jgi:hypothetical protein
MKLDEILSPGRANYELVKNTPTMFKVRKKIAGRPITVVCDFNEDEEAWEIAFYDTSSSASYASAKPTNDHAALEVFGFFTAAVQEFIDLHHPKRFLWSVEDDPQGEQRARIYSRLFKKNFPQYKAAEPDAVKNITYHVYALHEGQRSTSTHSEEEYRGTIEDMHLAAIAINKRAKVSYKISSNDDDMKSFDIVPEHKSSKYPVMQYSKTRFWSKNGKNIFVTVKRPSHHPGHVNFEFKTVAEALKFMLVEIDKCNDAKLYESEFGDKLNSETVKGYNEDMGLLLKAINQKAAVRYKFYKTKEGIFALRPVNNSHVPFPSIGFTTWASSKRRIGNHFAHFFVSLSDIIEAHYVDITEAYVHLLKLIKEANDKHSRGEGST